jgi:hypothetical protein
MALLDYGVAQLLRLYDGPETLLFVQAVAVASAVFPLASLGQRFLGGNGAGLALAWVWLLSPDVQSGLMFDYNPTMIGAPALIWTAWALLCGSVPAALIATLVTCLARENLCLYAAMVALVLGFRGVPWRRSLAAATLALLVFAADMSVLFRAPFSRGGDGYPHWRFEELGESPTEGVRTGLTHPIRTTALLVDHPQKRRSLLLPLLTTGYVGLADPLTMALQVPNWAERFLSTHRTRWWGYYYGAPAAATALVGLLLGWRRLRESGRAGSGLGPYVVACALMAGVFPPYHTPGGSLRSDLYRLRQPYASIPEEVATQRAEVAFIGRDPNLKVAAQYHLLPHLAGRKVILMLEDAQQADVVALQLDGGTFPEGRAGFKRDLRALWSTGVFHPAFCQGQSVVLRRGAGASVACPAWERFVSPLPPAG